jgi:hypothetical protein
MYAKAGNGHMPITFAMTMIMIMLIPVSFCAAGVEGQPDRIVGGEEALPHEFPWQVQAHCHRFPY